MKVKYQNKEQRREQVDLTLRIVATTSLMIIAIVAVIYLFLIWPLIPIFD